MANAIPLRVQLQEQRHLIDEQHIEIRHQSHQMNLQARRIVNLQAELDVIKGTVRRTAPNLPLTLEAPGNDHRRRVDEQQIEIRRQRRQMELQFRRIVDLQGELDAVKVTLRRTAPMPTFQQPQGSPGNGRRTARQ